MVRAGVIPMGYERKLSVRSGTMGCILNST